MKIAVSGAGGFMGGHMVQRLLSDGHEVVALGRSHRSDWWQKPRNSWVWDRVDLSGSLDHVGALGGCDRLYHFAADMGGRDWTDGAHDVACAKNALIDLNVLRAASEAGVRRLFYASSACIYATDLQAAWKAKPLSEGAGAPPWQPDGMYGLAKLYGEQACRAYAKDRGLEVRIGRYFGVFGPCGAWDGPRAKAPASLIRKAVVNQRTGAPIEVWGDGSQRRSYLYVDDAIEATIRLMESDYELPVNIGSDELLSVAGMAAICMEAAGSNGPVLRIPGPEGPHTRICDGALARDILGWRPTTSFSDGVAKTMPWIAEQVDKMLAKENV